MCANENNRKEMEKMKMQRKAGCLLEGRPQACWKGWIGPETEQKVAGCRLERDTPSMIAGGGAGSTDLELVDLVSGLLVSQ